MLIHRSLKPSKQCKKAAATAGAVLKTITRNFHYRDRNVFLRLYKQYVRPHLEFASQAWSPWLSSDINVIEKVQEKALGMVSGLKNKEYSERCREVGLDSLQTRRERHNILQVFKIMHGIDKVAPEALFIRVSEREDARTRLSADPMNIRMKRSKVGYQETFLTENCRKMEQAGQRNKKLEINWSIQKCIKRPQRPVSGPIATRMRTVP